MAVYTTEYYSSSVAFTQLNYTLCDIVYVTIRMYELYLKIVRMCATYLVMYRSVKTICILQRYRAQKAYFYPTL